MPFSDLLPLADEGSLYAYLRQVQLLTRLDERLGAHTWRLSGRSLVFTSVSSAAEERVPVEPVAWVGEEGLEWCDSEAGAEIRAYGAAHRLRSLGEDIAWAEPTTGQRLATISHRVGNAAVAVTGQGPYYCLPHDGAVLVVLATPVLPPIRIDDTTLAAITRVISGGDLLDERAALAGLARLAGWDSECREYGPDGLRCTMTVHNDGDGLALSVEFDAGCRLTRAGVLADAVA